MWTCFWLNLGVIAFELCDRWRYSLTKCMQNKMRAHSAGQMSMEGGVDVNKGHMVYTHVYEEKKVKIRWLN